uniref:capsule assembly Wzi family protein n=1 Tax=Algoriphagus sp. TaxID=1872435 RepID=UPI004047DB32
MIRYFLLFFIIFFLKTFLFAQESGFGSLTLDEYARRTAISVHGKDGIGLLLRSMDKSPKELFFGKDSSLKKGKLWGYEFLPVYTSLNYDGKRPYGLKEFGNISARGTQYFLSSGVKVNFSLFHIQVQPEWVWAENKEFEGFSDNFSSGVIASKFSDWNSGDSPEKFGNKFYSKFFLGQSSISIRYKAFEFGAGTRNFWWGPGQWNSLIFSNMSPGFLNISLNTTKPAKFFLGNFEGQVLIGRLESSGMVPTQNDDLNSKFFLPLNSDWRYLNAMMLSYNPKWIPALSFGYMRTYQYYNADRPNDLKGWLPILEPMAKEKLFTNGNSVIYDDRRQSQQIAIFGRYKMNKAKAEVYFQFGRRDHALNWREFIMNPEHARAYQVGFLKIASLPGTRKLLQVRAEITHQQESVNKYLRYGLGNGLSWHTHGQVRGFTNYGQTMGVGIGTGSNVQTLEIALVEDWKKWGILLERLENNQDFFYRAFGQQKEIKPWIDWSTALLWNTSYKDLFISARLQGVYARNYQWGLSKTSTPEFPVSQNLFSMHSQVNLIYFWGRGLKKKE